MNPGLRLYNLGASKLTPELKLITNVSYLQFDQVEALNVQRQDSAINNNIGVNISTGVIYRPFLNNNVQIKLSTGFLLLIRL